MKLTSLWLACLVVGSASILACEDETSTGTPPPAPLGTNFDGGTSGTVDSGPAPAAQCPAPTGQPTKHDKQIAADETWAAGIHEVTFSISIRQNATLTLAPCAVVRFAAEHGLSVGSGNVGNGGKLVAKGTATQPIVLEGRDAGRWSQVLVNPNGGSADLAYVTIKNSGSPASSRGGAALHVLGDQYQPIQGMAKVDHVTIEGSGKYGVILESRGAFAAGSQDLTITGSVNMPMRVTGPAIGTIPSGRYTGNTVDAIRLMASGGLEMIDADVTLRDFGVPYVVGGDGQFSQFSVQGANGTAPVLTIEAGVTMKFSKGDSGLFIERFSTTEPARGVLRVLGTAAKPVVFTSAEATPAAGDWIGITMRGVPNPQSKIDYARVEFAGGDTGTQGFSCGTPVSPVPGSNEAAIAIFGQPASVFVTNTTIVQSAANGIERAWTGTPMDFLTPNTFTNVAWCKQTFPRPTPPGVCPVPAPCDM